MIKGSKKLTGRSGVMLATTPEEDVFLKSQVEIRRENTLVKSILNVLDGPDQFAHRIGFEVDPISNTSYANLYKPKDKLIPDILLKRIAIQDSLVSHIVRARQNHLSAFGRPRKDRFSNGYIIGPNVGVLDRLTEEQKLDLDKRIANATKLLNSCGHTDKAKDYHQKTFAEWLSVSARDAVTVGRIATEIVYAKDLATSEKKFLYFVATDAGTIYDANQEDQTGLQSIRESAFSLLKKVTGDKNLKKEPASLQKTQHYVYAQVIDSTIRQVFTAEEMKCYNFFPANNYELGGYPITPIDTVITAITTHLNIGTHNKVYFQSGRASRGMLVIKSDEINSTVISSIKQQFNATINGAGAAWRLPVFGVPTETEVDWQPIDTSGSRDMEFQYLTDMNAREILTAFMMSPDELPGWSFLSRGTASQAMSESNNEFKLNASRDVGIRPLIMAFEDFINRDIFPLIDPELAEICTVRLVGLDADTPEKEIVNLQQNAQVWMTYNKILERVEQPLLAKRYCADIPLNPVYKGYLDSYCTVGEILEHFCGVEGASKDPQHNWYRDPLKQAQLQIELQQKQIELQQKMQAAAQQPQQAPPGGGNAEDSASQGPTDLSSSIDQAVEVLKKSEDALPSEKRRILQIQKKAAAWLIKGFEDDAKDAIDEILQVAKQVSPKSKK